MGNNMTRKFLSVITKPIRNFNIEDRAHKVISQDKPLAAPKHKTDQIDLERLMKEYPEAYQEGLRKHEQLDKHLKNVYVESHNSIPETVKTNPNRPLPLDRRQVQDFEYGIMEPEKVPLGKASLRQILKFITDHQSDPKLHSAQQIALDYSIPEDTIRNVLKYFKVYEVYIPEQRKTKAKFAGPSVPRIKIVTHHRKVIGAGKEANEK